MMMMMMMMLLMMMMITVFRNVMLCSSMLQRNLQPQSRFRRLVNFYQTTWRHMPGDCYLHNYTYKTLKPFKAMNLYFHKLSYLNNNCPAPQFFFWGGFTLQCSQWLLLDSTEKQDE